MVEEMEEGVKSGVFDGQWWRWEWRRDQVVWKMNYEAMLDPISCSYMKNIIYKPLFYSDHNPVAIMVSLVEYLEHSCSIIVLSISLKL